MQKRDKNTGKMSRHWLQEMEMKEVDIGDGDGDEGENESALVAGDRG